VEQVSQFISLGSLIAEEGHYRKHIQIRIEMAFIVFKKDTVHW